MIVSHTVKDSVYSKSRRAQRNGQKKLSRFLWFITKLPEGTVDNVTVDKVESWVWFTFSVEMSDNQDKHSLWNIL